MNNNNNTKEDQNVFSCYSSVTLHFVLIRYVVYLLPYYCFLVLI